jgi:hypothetical protein
MFAPTCPRSLFVTFACRCSQNQTNIGSIKIANFPERRLLENVAGLDTDTQWIDALADELETSPKDDGRRQLQDEPAERLKVTFNNCVFQYNSPGLRSELTQYGIILAETPAVDVIVNNSIFENNAFEGSEVPVSGKKLNWLARVVSDCQRLMALFNVDRATALPFTW